MKLVFLLHLFATFFMTGLIWLVQLVHYPLMDRVGTQQFAAYEQAHQRAIGPLVIIIMLAELGTGFALLGAQPAGLQTWQVWVGAALLGVIWLSTFLLQLPAHGALSTGFDPAVHQRLVTTNWIRTAAWSLRSGLLLWVLWKQLP
jgi:uncharacterized membrane protein